MKSEHYTDMYKFEWDRRSQLTSAANTPILGLTALGSVLATVSVAFPYESDLHLWFIRCTVLTGLLLATALFFVLLSLLDVKYKKLPSPLKLREYYKQLLDWHTKNNSPAGAAELDFQENIDEHLAVAAGFNGDRNNKRGAYIYIATALIAISMIPGSISAVLYVFSNANQPEKTYRVRLTQPKDGENIHDQPDKQQSRQPTGSEKSKKTPP